MSQVDESWQKWEMRNGYNGGDFVPQADKVDFNDVDLWTGYDTGYDTGYEAGYEDLGVQVW